MTKKLSFKSKKNYSDLKQHRTPRIPINLLLQEYEIVQQKIDNYGSSDISYKTLTTTLTAASLFASKKNYLGNNVLLATCLIITVILFSEGKNHIYERRLAARAQALEKAISKNGVIKIFPGIVQSVTGKNEVSFWDVINHLLKTWSHFLLYYGIIAFLLFHYFKLPISE